MPATNCCKVMAGRKNAAREHTRDTLEARTSVKFKFSSLSCRTKDSTNCVQCSLINVQLYMFLECTVYWKNVDYSAKRKLKLKKYLYLTNSSTFFRKETDLNDFFVKNKKLHVFLYVSL